MTDAATSLQIRRLIRASPERVSEAWTQPAQLRAWWGPRHVRCTAAEVDLREGGAYRLANLLPDGRTLWIVGHFERIDAPRELVYSWRIEPASGERADERVTVRFEPCAEGTEVIIQHDRVPDQKTRDEHQQGWVGCLERLASLLESA